MQSIAAFLFVYLFTGTHGHGVNYCGAKMCGYTNAHTFCQFLSGPSPSCTGMIPALLTPEEKSNILARLNQRRNDAASGKLRGFPSAGNMLKLRWVEELAKEAQLWANQCRPQKTPEELDACRGLYSISVGQCVASVVGEAPGLRAESMVDIWFMQNKYFRGNITLYELPEADKYFYGDFAQIMWARTFMVGCGRSRFMLPVNGRMRTIERLVCNFAPQGPIPHRPLWSPGVPATACPSRSRPCATLTSLCDYQKELNEPKDIDATMTIEDHILLNALLEIERNETLFEGSLDEIYLTYLAIVTMQTTVATTLRYNSMHKRDVVGNMYEDSNEGMNPDLSRQFAKSQIIENTTTKSKMIPRKKLTTVGRPKAYKIEELSNTGGEHKVKNHAVTEAVLKRKRDFYYDYTLDTLDDNITNTTEQKIKANNFTENNTIEDHSYRIILLNNTTKTFSYFNETEPNENREINTELHGQATKDSTTNNTVTSKENSVEDYLSDPETVRQLEDALDRMEHEASNSSSSTKKTRRDVQEAESSDEQDTKKIDRLPDDFRAPATNDVPSTTPDQHVLEQEANSSLDTPPVLSMMLKYMPYIKNYENELLGGTKSSAACIFPSICLMTIIFYA